MNKLFDNMNHAAQHGTREEFVQANREWYADAVKDQAAGECRDCLQKRTLHRWLSSYDLICEECDGIRRADYDAWYSDEDERFHRLMHGPEV